VTQTDISKNSSLDTP